MKEITPNPTDMSKPTSEEKNKQLPKALRGLIKLLDDGDLVRNTDGDADITVFMLRSVKIINAIRAAQEALIESTNQDSTTSLLRAKLNDTTVSRMLEAGAELEAIIGQLVDEKKQLIQHVIQLEQYAPRKIVLPDGRVMVWHCPDKLIPPSTSNT